MKKAKTRGMRGDRLGWGPGMELAQSWESCSERGRRTMVSQRGRHAIRAGRDQRGEIKRKKGSGLVGRRVRAF